MKARTILILVISLCINYSIFSQSINYLKSTSPSTQNKGLAITLVTIAGIGLGAALGAGVYMVSRQEHHPNELAEYAGVGALVGGSIALIVGIVAVTSNNSLLNYSKQKFVIGIPNIKYNYQMDNTTISILRMSF